MREMWPVVHGLTPIFFSVADVVEAADFLSVLHVDYEFFTVQGDGRKNRQKQSLL
jgi:hypothetical protein